MQRFSRYVVFHAALLATAAAFYLYTLLLELLFSSIVSPCATHNLFRLYCPFCGGTRLFRALLALDLGAAVRLNPAVLLLAVAAVCLDLRALWMICSKKQGCVLPRWTVRAAILLLLAFTVARNTMLLLGFDPIGDLWPYWQSRATPLLAIVFCLLLSLASLSFLLSIDFFGKNRLSRYRKAFAWSAAFLATALAAVLAAPAPLWLLFIPLTAGLAVCLLIKKRLR